MPNSLDKIHQILNDLAAKIHYRGSLFAKEEGNLQLSQWEREQAYCWLHATDHYLPLMSEQKEVFVYEVGDIYYQKIRKPVGRQHSIHFGDLTVDSTPPTLLSDKATSWYKTWFEQAGDLRNRPLKIIPNPKPEEIVSEYLYSLSAMALTQRVPKWRESLGSFLHFLRRQVQIDEELKINELFPEYMEISEDAIRRLIPNTAYPIDITSAAQIIQELIALVKGRSDSQYTSAQALALVWVSLSCAFARINPNVKFIHQLNTDRLSCKKASVNGKNCDHYFLNIISPNGDAEIPISTFLYDYLIHVAKVSNSSSKSSNLFTSQLRSLRRRLDIAVENSSV